MIQKNILKNTKGAVGTTFVELLLYISIFLIITPVLISVSVNTATTERQHNVDKQLNADSQFMIQRIYDVITKAKKVDVANSVFNQAAGKLTLIMQDNSTTVINSSSTDQSVSITEAGVTAKISSGEEQVQSLYFENIASNSTDPDIVEGVNVRITIKGPGKNDVPQNYVTSANLERGDYDGDNCPDYIDLWPKHPECCGDADGDGICDELDNCPMTYNPFQEDYDGDGIGDACDSNVFLGSDGSGSGTGGSGAFNCSAGNQLIALINQQPPLSSSTLKQILVSSSPLPPTVLDTLITTNPKMNDSDFVQVFFKNVKLSSDTYSELMSAPNVSSGDKILIGIADLIATYVPWVDQTNQSTYQISSVTEACGTPAVQKADSIKFSGSTVPLPSADSGQNSDVFVITVSGGTQTVKITTKTASGTATSTVTGGGHSATDSLGFMVSLESITGDSYAFTINAISNTKALDSVTFNFGCGATIVSPTSTYSSRRYVCYCQGGCADNCGDGGTGVIIDNVYTDRCYLLGNLLPEWCSKWETFYDDNNANPAYIGGTQVGEQTGYWEKTLKSMLTNTQMTNLKSITVGGQIAYQSTTQFFCDTLGSLCPMKGTLVGPQNIELYNWTTSQWDIIGVMGLNGTTSNQQTYEVKYTGTNPQKYFGSTDNRVIKERMTFHWTGVAPQGQTSAPAFMAIDYFTIHLKW